MPFDTTLVDIAREGAPDHSIIPPDISLPEFAKFNFYNPGINTLLADQICATPHIMLEDKSIGAIPGRLVQGRARCLTHIPLLGE